MVRDVLAYRAGQWKIPFVREAQLAHGLGSQIRPGDITFPRFSEGFDFVVDVTIGCPVAESYIRKAGVVPLYAAEDLAKKKHHKYDVVIEHYASENQRPMKFVPFAIESYGGFAPEAESFLKLLGRKYSNGPPPFSFFLIFWLSTTYSTLRRHRVVFSSCSVMLGW